MSLRRRVNQLEHVVNEQNSYLEEQQREIALRRTFNRSNHDDEIERRRSSPYGPDPFATLYSDSMMHYQECINDERRRRLWESLQHWDCIKKNGKSGKHNYNNKKQRKLW